MTDAPATGTPATDGPVKADRLDLLREQLEAVDQVPIEQRVALFDRANRALVSELDALGEV